MGFFAGLSTPKWFLSEGLIFLVVLLLLQILGLRHVVSPGSEGVAVVIVGVTLLVAGSTVDLDG